MAQNDHVRIVITQDSVSVVGPGTDIPLILSATAAFAERYREYTSLSGVAADFPVSTSAEYLAAQRMFGQNPAPPKIAIGRCANKPTQRYLIELQGSPKTNYTYKANVKGKGVTSSALEVKTYTNPTFTATAATDQLAIAAHGMSTGDGPFRVTNSGGALPTGLAVDTDYWVIKVDADNIKLASSKANALAATAIDLTSAGTGTHTLNTATNDVIMAGLVDRLNGVTGKNYTAALLGSSGSFDCRVTGTAAGDYFSIEVGSPDDLKSAQDHADPGLAADLTAIKNENDSWYGVVYPYSSNACVLAIAAWVEANEKLYFAGLAETDSCTVATGSGTDTAKQLNTLAYKRTATFYHPSPADMFDAGILARFLATEPGKATVKFKTVTGVTPTVFTATHKTNLRARKMNAYETTMGVPITWEGTLVGGEFIDVTRNDDWVKGDMGSAIYATLAANDVVPMTQPGVDLVCNDVQGSLERAKAKGIYASYAIQRPKVSQISSANKAARILPDIRFSAVRAGAIHNVDPVNGVISL